MVGFVISWPLVYFLGAYGAAICVTTSLCLIALDTYIQAKKI